MLVADNLLHNYLNHSGERPHGAHHQYVMPDPQSGQHQANYSAILMRVEKAIADIQFGGKPIPEDSHWFKHARAMSLCISNTWEEAKRLSHDPFAWLKDDDHCHVKHAATFGRFLTAGRDFKTGSHILQDREVLIIPYKLDGRPQTKSAEFLPFLVPLLPPSVLRSILLLANKYEDDMHHTHLTSSNPQSRICDLLTGIIHTNGFDHNDGYITLYLRRSLLNHGKGNQQNVRVGFPAEDEQVWPIKALADIRKGDPLLLDYDPSSLQAAVERRYGFS